MGPLAILQSFRRAVQPSLRPGLLFARSLSTDASHEHFFQYTSGRWIHDEERQLALRYQRFDVDALKSVALQCTGADAVVDMRKVAEAGFNKIFRLQLNGAPDVIARIRTPRAGPAHLVTASEVATMEFVRNRLGKKMVPRVLSWSSRASETPVGSEYILTDVADGVELRDVWHTLDLGQKMHAVGQWVGFEVGLIQAITGGGYGSLYYRRDVPSSQARDVFVGGVRDDEFVLGPSMQLNAWGKHDGLDPLEIDRGPCMSFLVCALRFTHRVQGRTPRRTSRPLLATSVPSFSGALNRRNIQDRSTPLDTFRIPRPTFACLTSSPPSPTTSSRQLHARSFCARRWLYGTRILATSSCHGRPWIAEK